MRVDVDAPLTGSGNPFYNRTSAIPVVQINDIVGGQSVTTLAVHDAVALASPLDNSGSPLPVNRGDHAVAFHAGYSGGSMIVRANHVDADQDGLFDHWETTGLDMDRDGVVDFSLTSFGTNRLRRDLFLEIDWLSPDTPTSNPMNHRDFSPQAKALDDVVSTFATAPVTNPDNSMGITVHIDAGAALSRPAGVPR